MSVLLINPSMLSCLPNKEYIPPPSLLSLAAVLQLHKIDVGILDLNIYQPWCDVQHEEEFCADVIIKTINEQKPLLVGFGCLFSGLFPSIIRYAKLIKCEFPHIEIAVGGMHPTTFPKDIIVNCEFIDYVVIGEGETQILEIAKNLLSKSKKHYFAKLDGIAFRENGEVIVLPKTYFIKDLDILPFAAYNLIQIDKYYHSTIHWHNPKRLSFQMTCPIISSA